MMTTAPEENTAGKITKLLGWQAEDGGASEFYHTHAEDEYASDFYHTHAGHEEAGGTSRSPPHHEKQKKTLPPTQPSHLAQASALRAPQPARGRAVLGAIGSTVLPVSGPVAGCWPVTG